MVFGGGGLLFLHQVPTSTFWQSILSALGQPSSWTAAFRAFFIGHLGKYVPSKLLVVAIRAGLIAGPKARLTLCATSVFVETLTTMAVGAGIATLLVIWLTNEWWVWAVAGGGLVLCFVGSLPMTLRQLARILLRRRWTDEMDAAFLRLRPGLLLRGWGYGAVTWLLMACSLWATLQMVPTEQAVIWSWPLAVRCLAAVCLAVVAGFVSQLPAGLLAREWVLHLLLLPVVGTTLAVAAPVLLRVNWLLTELVGSAILLCVPVRSPSNIHSEL